MDDISSLSSENYTDSEDELKEESSYTSDSDEGTFECENELIDKVGVTMIKERDSWMNFMEYFGNLPRVFSKNILECLKENDEELLKEKLKYEKVNSMILCYAIDHSNLEILKIILSNYSTDNFLEESSIIVNYCIISGKYELLDYVLKYYGNETDILDQAIGDEVYEVIKYLFDKGIRTDDCLNKIILSNFFSIWNEMSDLFIYIYNKSVVTNEENEKLLISALKCGRMNIFKFLVEKGVNVNVKNGEILHLLLQKKDYENIILIKDLGLDVTLRDNFAIKNVIECGNLEMVKLFCSLGADINEGFEKASSIGNFEIIKFLLDIGADVHYKNNIALNNLIIFGDVEMVKYLVDRGADIHVDSDNALVNACLFNNIDVVKYLIEIGADIHVENDEPLKLALGKYDMEMAIYLLENGADPNARDGGFFVDFSYDEETISLLLAFGGKGLQIKYLEDTEIFFRKQLDCPITKEEINELVELVGCELCKNIFSREGLEGWIKRGKKICPMCRKENVSFYKVKFEDTKE